jgi:hypothetical protein
MSSERLCRFCQNGQKICLKRWGSRRDPRTIRLIKRRIKKEPYVGIVQGSKHHKFDLKKCNSALQELKNNC